MAGTHKPFLLLVFFFFFEHLSLNICLSLSVLVPLSQCVFVCAWRGRRNGRRKEKRREGACVRREERNRKGKKRDRVLRNMWCNLSGWEKMGITSPANRYRHVAK
jgi:hypothetical protein